METTGGAKALESVDAKFPLFDTSFNSEAGEKVKPNGKVTISFPIFSNPLCSEDA